MLTVTPTIEKKPRKKYTRKPRSKLAKVNVPELLYSAFFEQVPPGRSSVIDKMRSIKPQPRGRGLTRLLVDITEDEWEDLYARVCIVRSRLKGCDRKTQLRAAICAKAMSFRMEKAGVTSVIKYETPERINGVKKTDLQPVTPSLVHGDDVTADVVNPITLDTVDDIEEVDASDLERFQQDIQLGS